MRTGVCFFTATITTDSRRRTAALAGFRRQRQMLSERVAFYLALTEPESSI
jgi:hypothetical protein